ncbi:MAG: class flavin-dependent oxidoreductase, partial [Rhodospirillales bacterium]|nr:class flavin-dependent oxidoreductase [Rhodospirillales bacterium]
SRRCRNKANQEGGERCSPDGPVEAAPFKSTSGTRDPAAPGGHGGRLSVGLGVGGRTEDYVAVNADLGQRRQENLRRFVDTLRRTWAGETVRVGANPIGPLPTRAGGIPPILVIPASSIRSGNQTFLGRILVIWTESAQSVITRRPVVPPHRVESTFFRADRRHCPTYHATTGKTLKSHSPCQVRLSGF